VELPVCQWLMSLAVFFIIILFFMYIAFLVGGKTLYSEVWLQFIICILIIISTAVFGSKFRGSQPYLPFGWSYWLAVVSACLFLINGCFLLFVAIAVRKKDKLNPMKLYVTKGWSLLRENGLYGNIYAYKIRHLMICKDWIWIFCKHKIGHQYVWSVYDWLDRDIPDLCLNQFYYLIFDTNTCRLTIW